MDSELRTLTYSLASIRRLGSPLGRGCDKDEGDRSIGGRGQGRHLTIG